MAGELIKNLAGLDIVHVPYKGSTGARADIVSGQIDLMFDSVPTAASTDRERPAQGARHVRQGAFADPAECPDHRGSRNSGL